MDGVTLTELKKINHNKGDILKVLKKSDISFNGFGEAYFSEVNKGCIKGWKKHTKMTLNIIVVIGEIEFVIYNEITKTFIKINISKNNNKRLTIEPGLWMAFRGIDNHNILLNLANIEHNPNEVLSVTLNDIFYDWA